MDTRATSHLHAQLGILKKLSTHDPCSSVIAGDGSKIVVSNMGNTDLSFTNPYRPLSLKNVLITPNIIKNLIFVCRFTNDNSCSIEFDPYGFSVKDLQTKTTLLRCDNTDDLYLVTSSIPQALLSSNPNLWHQCLGHPGRPVFNHLVSNHLLPCKKH